jgi:hypothetical protein
MQNTERTETEQRKNKETRCIYSLIISRQRGQKRHLKKSGTGKIGNLKKAMRKVGVK